MSWLGVNLNDSLNNLKGQLSSFTNNVLAEDFDGEDDDSQVIVPRDRIKELEALCQLQKHELEESKRARGELEERLYAADIHAAHQNKVLRHQLQETENELKVLKDKSIEWGWDTDGPASNHIQNHDGSQNHVSGADYQNTNSHHSHETTLNSKFELQNQQLSTRVRDLERELEGLRDAHQEQVAVLQDQHRQQLSALKQQGGAASTKSDESEDGLPEQNNPRGKEAAAWEQERHHLEKEKEEISNRVEILQRQVQQLKQKGEEETKELSSKLSTLTEDNKRLQEENEQFTRNLEELDGQHQVIIEQILKKKNNLQEEIEESKKLCNNLNEQVAHINTEKLHLESEIEKLQNEYAENTSALAGVIKEDLNRTTDDNGNFKGHLISLKEQLHLSSVERTQLLEERKKLQEQLEIVKSQHEHSTNVAVEHDDNLDKTNQQLQETNTNLQFTLENLTAQMTNLKVSESNVQEALKESEEKRNSSEVTIQTLNTKISQLEDQISKLTSNSFDRKSQHEQFLESQKEVSGLTEKLSVLEQEKAKYEENLKAANQMSQDAKSRTEILESQLQAKVQELEISNERIVELQTKSKNVETEASKLRKHKNDHYDQLKTVLTSHNIEVVNNWEKDLHNISELVRDSIWQRDTLERHISSMAQELREKNDQLQEAETARVDLERECEDLRDQLEEIQNGVRAQPEGSSRGLPTIEEESEAGAEGESDGGASAAEPSKGENRTKINQIALQENAIQIKSLQDQVEALTEARSNLETEVSNMREERETLHSRVRDAEGRTGNYMNLETEVVSLRAERNALELRLASLTQQIDVESVTLKDERDTLEEQVSLLEEHINRMRAEMTLNRHERESIGQQLLCQYKVVEDREATIRILESELDGLKDALRNKFSEGNSDANIISQLQEKETKLTEDLNGIRSQIIYKDDRIDELTQGLERISEIFGMKCTNPDQVHQHLNRTYYTVNKQVKDQEAEIEELKRILQSEKEQMEKNSSLLQSESSLREQKEEEAGLFKDKYEKSEMEVFQLREKLEELTGTSELREAEISKLHDIVHNLEAEKEASVSSLNVSASELDTLNKEKNKLLDSMSSEKEVYLKLQEGHEAAILAHKQEVTELNNKVLEVTSALSKLTADKEKEIEEKESAIHSLKNEIMQLQQNTPDANSVQESEQVLQQQKLLKEESEKLLQEKTQLKDENEKLSNENKEIICGRDTALQQVTSLQMERDQMIATLTQKHQESVSYHSEIQRLMQVLNQMSQTSTEEKSSIEAKLKEKDSLLIANQSQVTKLQEELIGMKKIKEDLQKSVSDDIIKKTEISGLQKEIDTFQTKCKSLEQERDQLRVANSHFNTQYQEQSKELANLKEKEARLNTESERLRQHLVVVEESYTAEAIKSEERESTLRSTLSKLEEKLNNHSSFYSTVSHRASVQVETLQEQVRDLTREKDEAIQRLHTAEELSEQHQQSLATLQQVLQDFQKGQSREISEATERTRRDLETEKETNQDLLSQIKDLKSQLAEVQSALAAASRLGEQLGKKDQMIIALKAQVTSQEEATQKARDELICLRTTSEGKIEKNLLRNLLVGYFATPTDKRKEVLHVIAEVLSFSGEERMRTGVDTAGTTWLSSLANFLAPPPSNVHVTSKVDVLDHSSLSQAFIRFLEDESTPRPQARLPAVQMAKQTEEKAEKKAQVKAQAVNKVNPFVSLGEVAVTDTKSNSRNSPLLAAASAPPTLPTFTPIDPSSATNTTGTNPTTLNTSVLEAGSSTPVSVSNNKYLTSLLGSDAATPMKGDGK